MYTYAYAGSSGYAPTSYVCVHVCVYLSFTDAYPDTDGSICTCICSFEWISSHLRSAKYKLWRHLPDDVFRGPDGRYLVQTLNPKPYLNCIQAKPQPLNPTTCSAALMAGI